MLLNDDARFPWLILVPRRPALCELHDLSHAERMVLIEEMARAGKNLKAITQAAKINTAALGNQVPQLHVHIVARHPGDAAWPGAVWGSGAAVPYAEETCQSLLDSLQKGL